MKGRLLAGLAAGALLVAAGRGAALAQTADADPVEQMAQAKAVFEQACNVCHGLERPLSKTFDEAGWVRTVERMHEHGAEVDRAARSRVVSFLLAKNIFEARCSTCHGAERPLGASKTPAQWLETVRRMAGMRPGSLTEAEAAAIAAYLSIVRPAAK